MANNSSLDDKIILITGGTGSFGQQFVRTLLQNASPAKIIVFSRDELKQFEMRQSFPENEYPRLRFFLGDVRDRDRLYRAVDGVDIVVHAAALKQVPSAEYNPGEAVKTNVLGTMNVIDAAIDRNVKKVIALSTDKAVNPINLYGATKLCADKLMIAANNYSGYHGTRFSIVRYGNVVGSRGSVIPSFLRVRPSGRLPITDGRMTRFWITVERGAEFVIQCLDRMSGGEIFVPKIPSMKMMDLAKAIAPECEIEIIGIRPGEKLHEVLITEDDSIYTLEHDEYFVILPSFRDWSAATYLVENGGKRCVVGFSYRSDTNTQWLSLEDMRTIIGKSYEEISS